VSLERCISVFYDLSRTSKAPQTKMSEASPVSDEDRATALEQISKLIFLTQAERQALRAAAEQGNMEPLATMMERGQKLSFFWRWHGRHDEDDDENDGLGYVTWLGGRSCSDP
jgi:hypothetical protein